MPDDSTYNQPFYLELAWGELDTAEFPGSQDNPKVVAYHSYTDGGSTPDAISWCSSFVCACVERAGLKSPHSKAAISWMRWGEDAGGPHYGDICVLWRGETPADWQSHVGFVVGWDDTNVYLLGGNQSDRVRASRYPRNKVRGFRRSLVAAA